MDRRRLITLGGLAVGGATLLPGCGEDRTARAPRTPVTPGTTSPVVRVPAAWPPRSSRSPSRCRCRRCCGRVPAENAIRAAQAACSYL